MVRRYSIILKSQLGPKAGTLKVRDSRDMLLGVLELLGHKSLLTGKTVDDGSAFEFTGDMWTPLGRLECRISGTRRDHSISGKLNVSGKTYELSGNESI
jgi:hypothetical protein